MFYDGLCVLSEDCPVFFNGICHEDCSGFPGVNVIVVDGECVSGTDNISIDGSVAG